MAISTAGSTRASISGISAKPPKSSGAITLTAASLVLVQTPTALPLA
jgi:hypothetical protein